MRTLRRRSLTAALTALALIASAVAGASPVSARAPDPVAPKPASTSNASDPGTPAPVSAPTSPEAEPDPSTPIDSTSLIEDNPKLDSQLLVAAGVPGSAPESTGDVPRYDGDRVSVVVSGPAAADAVADAGGEVITKAGEVIAAYVPSSQLTDLADSDLVTAVRAPAQAEPAGVMTEGIAASGGAAWQAAGNDGGGVRVAVVDIGFGTLTQETANGNLPGGLTVASNRCGSAVNSSSHGTAVAEVVHQTAPGAQLVLYCIQDSSEFKAAVQDIAAAGIRLATSSLGFPGDARGDGVIEDPMSAAAAVKYANQDAGIFWIQSAGNSGDAHFRGAFDGTASQLVDTVSAMSFANGVAVEWDQWSGPVANVLVCVQLVNATHTVQGAQVCSANNFAPSRATPRVTRGMSAVSGVNLFYEISLSAPPELSGARFDVTYSYGTWNGVSSPKITSGDVLVTGGSITSPASSPYAFAVGAIDVSSGLREPFSGQGPTIDGRTKPDIAGYDNTSSNIYKPTFYGTSAAAPSVAGAAALLLAANPGWSAAEIGDYLRAHANSGTPVAPPSNTLGAGKLGLGPAPTSALGFFIIALYQDILGRTPSAGEIGYWIGNLSAGLSRTTLVNAIVVSTEALNRVVTQIYADALGRVPDPGGLAGWGAQLQRSTYASVIASILGSAESVARAPSRGAWITGLYSNGLGRSPGAAEVSYWSAVYSASGSLAVSTAIIDSAEARNRRAALMYERFLGRAADAESIPFWNAQIAATGDLAVWVGFLGSPEYFARASDR